MIIAVKVSKIKYFRQALEILRSLPEIEQLATRDLDVLAYLLYYNYKYKDIDKELRGKLIFDYDIKMKICEEIGMSEAVLNNIIGKIRKSNIVVGRDIINTYLLAINPDTPDVTFKFTIEDVS